MTDAGGEGTSPSMDGSQNRSVTLHDTVTAALTAARETLESVLRGAGISDNPAEFDSDIHSWRCSYPDIYGPCSCFADLVNALSAREALVLAKGRAEAWDAGQRRTIEDHGNTCHRTYRLSENPYRRANPESEDR